jgi:alpha-aminoadipate carrier protein LysW
MSEKTEKCPLCGGNVSIKDQLMIGELLDCPDCNSELEVKNLFPVDLQEAPQVAEDWGE